MIIKREKKSLRNNCSKKRKSTKRYLLKAGRLYPSENGKFPIIFRFKIAMYDDVRLSKISSERPNAIHLLRDPNPSILSRDDAAKTSFEDAIRHFYAMYGGISEKMQSINLILNQRYEVIYLEDYDSVLLYTYADKDYSDMREQIAQQLITMSEYINSYDGYEFIEFEDSESTDLKAIPCNGKFYKLTNVLLVEL